MEKIFATLVFIFFCSALSKSVAPKYYKCNSSSGFCELQDQLQRNSSGVTQSICMLTCGNGMIWPNPIQTQIGEQISPFCDINFEYGSSQMDFQKSISYAHMLISGYIIYSIYYYGQYCSCCYPRWRIVGCFHKQTHFSNWWILYIRHICLQRLCIRDCTDSGVQFLWRETCFRDLDSIDCIRPIRHSIFVYSF